jgi:hypothetical protein
MAFCRFDKDEIDYDMVFVNLEGRGIRDMARVGETDNQFLIVAGPVGDEPVPYKLYLWNGKNTVPGKDNAEAGDHAKALCIIPPPDSAPMAKAEGIAFVEIKKDTYRFIIVYDGVEDGAATLFSCST